MSERPHFQRLEEVFLAAEALPPSEREAFVDGACAGDEALAADVRALLTSARRADGAWERAIHAGVEDVTRGWARPDRVGPYRLLEPLGEGGMGSVWLAERDDDEFHRRVAVKLIRPGAGGVALVRRFRSERQILADLDHPNVARLLDGGTTEDGLPWLVMEHVDGVPIDVYCDGRHLSVESRLRLFLRVCDAVAHAHQRLVVHRDLKPGNVLVTEDGTPKLLDFGVADLLRTAEADAELTRTVAYLMTPAYAAPEQVRGEPTTTATDVYALGLLLYELLTGQAPQRVGSLAPADVQRVVCDELPARPSTAVLRTAPRESEGHTAATPETVSEVRGTVPFRLARTLSGDLDNIVLMALRKEPQRRYSSVEALAADVQAYLELRPVRARPSTVRYRARKFVSRNRGALGATVAGVMLLAGVIGFSGRRLQQERDRAQLEAARAQRVSDFMTGVFELADIEYASGTGGNVTAQELLRRGAERAGAELPDEPLILASFLSTIGTAEEGLGNLERARILWDSALVLRRRFAGERSAEVASSLTDLGSLYYESGQYDSALVVWERAMALRADVQGERHNLYAEAVNNVGKALQELGQYERATELVQRAHELHRLNEGDEAHAVAMTLLNLGQLWQLQGEPERALAAEREAVAISRAREARNEPNDLPTALHNLGTTLQGRRELEEAEASYREALALISTRGGTQTPAEAATLVSLASLLEQKGEVDEAEETYRRAIAMERPFLGADHPNLAYDITNLANLYTRNARYDAAEPLYREAVGIVERSLPEDNAFRARPIAAYGELLVRTGRSRAAEPLLRDALAVAEAAVGPSHPFVASVQSSLGAALMELGRSAEAVAPLEAALATLTEAFGAEDGRTDAVRERLVGVYEAQGRLDDLARIRGGR
ncbi:MAG: tetratricopeptide repeat protein [Gemmatimonadetes bacterium]|nr:tetratricopeptide repeat protein [Gemmatimonadota bacterium]